MRITIYTNLYLNFINRYENGVYPVPTFKIENWKFSPYFFGMRLNVFELFVSISIQCAFVQFARHTLGKRKSTINFDAQILVFRSLSDIIDIWQLFTVLCRTSYFLFLMFDQCEGDFLERMHKEMLHLFFFKKWKI